LAAATACSGPGSYVWFTELSPEALAAASEYAVDVGDVLSIRVLGHEDMSTRVRVRADGRIALPIIGEVEARGKQPIALQKEIERRLKEFVITPTVTLNIEETPPSTITVMGEVARPGVYPVAVNTHLAEALALSGGVTEYASHDRIFLVRNIPRPVRIRFTYQAVTRDEQNAAAFLLRAGDVIVVE
jgi:polysaccharide export outer membrane protein